MFFKNAFLIIVFSLVMTLSILSGVAGASITIPPNPTTLQGLIGDITIGAANCDFINDPPDLVFEFPSFLTEGQAPEQDPNFNYPFGLVEIGLMTCTGAADVDLTFTLWQPPGAPADLTGLTYRKYGPTPVNPTPHWYDFTFDGQTGAEINGNVATLHFIDGQRGDDDLTINGRIIDQGGPANGLVPVPTMTQWGMIIFIVLAGIISVYCLKRRKTAG